MTTTTQRYPSPTQAQSGSDGPFYSRQSPSDHSPHPQHVQEEADDLQLRADLARSLAPISDSHQQPPHDHETRSPNQYDAQNPELELHAQLSHGDIAREEGSPADLQGLDAAAKRNAQRQKVSRACDECRRKKARSGLSYSASSY